MTAQSSPVRRLAAALLLACMALFAASPVLAAEPGGATTFKAGDAPAKVDANDPMALLASCDRQLEECKTDAVGMPYLIAAYLALWAILVVYFFLARRGQQKLEAELQELRARLRDYEEQFLSGAKGDKA